MVGAGTTSRSIVTDLVRSFALVRAAAPVGSVLLLVALLVQGVIPALLIWVTKSVVDLAARAVALGGVAWVEFLPAVALWVGGLLLESSLSPWAAALQGNLNEKLTARVNLDLMRKADSLPGLTAFESAGFYDELQVLRDQAAYQPVNLLVYVTNAFRELVVIASVLALLATVAWWIPLLVVLAAVPHALVQFALQRNAWETMVSRSPQARLMQYLSSLLLTDTYAKEARLFGFGPWVRGRYEAAFADTHSAMRRVRLKQAGWANLLVAVSALANGFAFLWVVARAAAGAVGAGSILLLVQSLLYLQQNLLLVAQDGSMLQETLAYFRKFFAFLAAEPDLPTSASARPAPELEAQGIELVDVSFAYPDGREALQGVSLRLAPGRVTALVGENGAGKSTVAKLLARFYDPASGRVLVEGVDLRELDLDAWRASVGAVLQDFGRYQFTVEENLLLGDGNLDPGGPATRELLGRSGLAELVARLDGGLDARLGKQFGGTELSGGEWQKVALARALARRDQAQLLILDEPTSALDPRAEYELYREFAALAAGVTTLLITHRLASVRMADVIYVLEEGRVVEVGSHEELLAVDGVYAGLWRMQAEGFREVGA